MKFQKLQNWFQDIDRLRIFSISALCVLLLALGLFSGTRQQKRNLSLQERSEELEKISEQVGEAIHFSGIDLEIIDNDAIKITHTLKITSAGLRYFKGIAPGINSGHTYADGSKQTYTIEVIEAIKDGAPEHFEVKAQGDELKRIYVFNPEKNVSRGIHSYQISYLVRGAIVQMPDHNALAWQALHPIWSLPVKQLAMRIRFPQSTHLSSVEYSARFQGPDGQLKKGNSQLEAENNGVLLWPEETAIKPYSRFFATVKWPR